MAHDSVVYVVVKCVGVGVAVFGACVSAQQGARLLADPPINALRRLRARLMKPKVVHISASDSGVGIDSSAVARGQVSLSGSGNLSVPDRFAAIENAVDSLTKRVGELQGELRHMRDVLRHEIEPVRTGVLALRREFEQYRERETHIDARALPLIGVGIIPSGLPDQYVRHGWVQALIAVSMLGALAAYGWSRSRLTAT